MELLDQKVQVAPTAALVLYQARDIFNEGIACDYMSSLDLSAIQPMAEKLGALPSLSHVIQFRKQYLRFLADAYLPDSEPVQIVILGAGLDPLGLQLLERYGGDIARIFEVDTAHLAEKDLVYRKIAPEANNLHLVHCDITDPQHLRNAWLLRVTIKMCPQFSYSKASSITSRRKSFTTSCGVSARATVPTWC
ncbi:class I SAM-dependent methyltransferase [Chitinophaga sedimenti]|uniref:class I SAM-dependent methyltransferase n=1 Tax=Chitinophaga sedimenti TaxID=2033606 RepID=UPI002005FC3B|nr:class I SAM-dependent methyltransferase [Chitinophaga sedimenti]MCK7559171.1 class I SAM-dependent methyltransferase [Chitinophaga sedimenti]